MPIYELVRISTAAGHVGLRLANLQRAYDEYLQQFDSCRCVPCQHNGMAVLTGTSCKCICKSGYQGDACEETHGKGETFFKTAEVNAVKSPVKCTCTKINDILK